MFRLKDNFEWNMLGIYNYNKPGKLDFYFNFLSKNLDKEGDLIEAGVFRGSSLLSVAHFLKKHNSEKKVYGYDSFSGFPNIYHENDSLNKYDEFFENKLISEKHYKRVQSSKNILQFFEQGTKTESISVSGDFSGTSKNLLEKKIKFLGLDNIKLIDGDFSHTMSEKSDIKPKKILAGIIDCDLYNSYKTTLKYIYPKLVDNGLLYLDEYYSLKFPGAKIAVDEFSKDKIITLKKVSNNKSGFERWVLFKC